MNLYYVHNFTNSIPPRIFGRKPEAVMYLESFFKEGVFLWRNIEHTLFDPEELLVDNEPKGWVMTIPFEMPTDPLKELAFKILAGDPIALDAARDICRT